MLTATFLLLGVVPQQPAAAPAWPGLAELPGVVEAHQLSEPIDALRAYLRDHVERRKGAALAPAIARLFDEPLGVPGFAVALTDRLHAAATSDGGPDVAALAQQARTLLDLGAAEPVAVSPSDPLFAAAGWPERLAAARARIEAAADLVERALQRIDVAQRPAFRDALRTLLDDFVAHIYVHEKQHDVETWRQVAQDVDLASLCDAARTLAPLCDPRFYRPLGNQIRRGPRPPRAALDGVHGNVLLAEETFLGAIVIGGSGHNRYDLPVALLIDIGGNDTYGARATHSDDGNPVNVVIDVAGRDRYEAAGHFAQGCGLLGVSLLVDHAGDDEYQAGRAAQGCGVVGVGVLIDRQGRDRYTGDAFVQGAGCFGLGAWIDLDGNDVLDAGVYAQGFAWPLSVGALIDADGDDARTATGRYPSSYGTEGQHHGGSQGTSIGFRTLASGGFGVLIDGGGDDVSRAGEFSHGCGYYLGCGIVRDRGGDDQVFAARYGIATGAHMGVGVVLDDRGDDLWQNPITASCGGNWDATVSFLCDAAGDDRYVGAGITLGSSTISSLAGLIDGDGEDRYECAGAQCFGNAGHPEDAARGTRSVALFLDLGGDRDVYPAVSLDPKPGDGIACRRTRRDGEAVTGVGAFVDR